MEKPKLTPIYKELGGFTFEGAETFLDSRNGEKDIGLTNSLTSAIFGLALGDYAAALMERTMPNSLVGVNKDILFLDTLAYVTTVLHQAAFIRHKRDRDDSRAWLETSTMVSVIKRFKIDGLGEPISIYWLDRVLELRGIEDPHERFGALCYLLVTSKGHDQPMKRYPGSPPVYLGDDLVATLEQPVAELTVGGFILDALDVFYGLVARMQDPDDFDDDDNNDG